jgi:hypothetical protein
MIRGARAVVAYAVVALAVAVKRPPPPRALGLEVTAGDKVIWRGAVERSEPFDLAFIHSSERCRWTQHYRAARAGDVEQVASTFSCFGSGMPSVAADGAPVHRSPRGYTVSAPAHIGDLPMMASRSADIVLEYRGRTIPIGRWFADFERVTVRVR